MLLHPSILLNPSSGDGKLPRTEALPAANNARKLSRACLSTVFYEGMERGNLLWSPPGRMGDAFCYMSRSCCAMKRPFCSPRVWAPRFKTMRKKLSLVPPRCHGEMEIVSVKELADGSLQFTFGGPTESAITGDELSSINGEHLAGKLKNSSRRPSRFRKQSPVPVMAARLRKKKPEGLPIENVSDGGIRESSEGSLKLLSRPKSSFVKRSPIPSGKDLRSGRAVSEARRSSSSNVKYPENAPVSNKQLQEGPRKGKIIDLSEPVSQKMNGAGSDKEIETSRARPLPFSNGSPDFSTETLGEQPAFQHLRPRSKFYRRSPISKVGSQTAQKSSLSKGLSGNSQRQTVLSHLDANSQIGLARAEEASRNVDETEDIVKSSDSGCLPDYSAPPDLRKYKLPELKSIAKSMGLKGYSRLKKDELIDLIHVYL